MFKLEFETDHPVFDNMPGTAISHILGDIADGLFRHPHDTEGVVTAPNGDIIGKFRFVDSA